MTDGSVIINGPTTNNNGALDYYYTCEISSGFLLVVGSSGMAQLLGTSSTQYSLKLTFPSSQSANTIIHIASADGAENLTFMPTKAYQSVIFSSPILINGVTYTVYTGGSATGTIIDNLYTDGTYTAGTEIDSFTISSIVISIGSAENSAQGQTAGDPAMGGNISGSGGRRR